MGAMITYCLTITIVKIAILLLYRRIFSTKAFRQKTLIVGTACLIWFFITIFLDIFQCHPFRAAFECGLLFTEHCIDLQAYYWGVTGANLGLDVVMLFLPLHMVWDLKISRTQKLGLSGIFLLGST